MHSNLGDHCPRLSDSSRIRFWEEKQNDKKKAFPVILLFIILLLPVANAPGSITLTPGIKIAGKYGSLTVVKTMTMASMTNYANGTMLFNVTGYELTQLTYQFTLTAYGNGTWPIRFAGRIPITVTALNAQTSQYISPWQQINYNTIITTQLIIVYGNIYPTESQNVGFRDDFLYTNPMLTTDWTIDQYYNPGIQSGISTSSGYMTLTNKDSISTLKQITDHVTSTPVFTPSPSITAGTVIKRKLTVALISFTIKQTSGFDNLHIGLTHLITAANAYPQVGTAPPYATPNTVQAKTPACTDSTVTADNIGIEYIEILSTGANSWNICGDPAGQISGAFANIDPTKYTVITIITQAVFCYGCPDNAQAGTAWVYHRIYQEDSTGAIIAGTDQNHNQTANVAPYSGTAPVIFYTGLSTGGSLPETSKIDFVQWQNYGSPVCLVAPTGALCTRLPPNPGHLTNDFVGSIAWLATLLGGGDEQAGAIIMFLIMSAGMAGMPYLFTRNIPFSSLGEMSVLGFFIYAGFLPAWTLFLVLLMGAVIIVMMVNRIIGGHSLMGGGGANSE